MLNQTNKKLKTCSHLCVHVSSRKTVGHNTAHNSSDNLQTINHIAPPIMSSSVGGLTLYCTWAVQLRQQNR